MSLPTEDRKQFNISSLGGETNLRLQNDDVYYIRFNVLYKNGLKLLDNVTSYTIDNKGSLWYIKNNKLCVYKDGLFKEYNDIDATYVESDKVVFVYNNNKISLLIFNSYMTPIERVNEVWNFSNSFTISNNDMKDFILSYINNQDVYMVNAETNLFSYESILDYEKFFRRRIT